MSGPYSLYLYYQIILPIWQSFFDLSLILLRIRCFFNYLRLLALSFYFQSPPLLLNVHFQLWTEIFSLNGLDSILSTSMLYWNFYWRSRNFWNSWIIWLCIPRIYRVINSAYSEWLSTPRSNVMSHVLHASFAFTSLCVYQSECYGLLILKLCSCVFVFIKLLQNSEILEF